MISYSQNFEDVILARALEKVSEGVYMDLGAADSTYLSVTRHFYDKGWRGINVEPNPITFDALADARPRDLNLKVGISATAGQRKFYCVTDHELSTFDEALGESYLKEFPGSFVSTVEIITPETLIGIANKHFDEVHFLKIDIEGHEAEVLNNWNFTSLAPWIVIVESTHPRTRIASHEKWENSLIESGYRFVYEDGLNRFYLHEHKAQLAEYFRYPPNLFDEFITHAEALAKNENILITRERDALLSSRSWKITYPVRRLAKFFKLI
jgi:FkbM family methyltransferase